MSERLVKAWAMRLLLPLLLINVTVANQLWALGPVMISQVLFFWPAIICAFLIVVLTWGAMSIWPLLLVVAIVGARAIGVNDAPDWRYYLYGVPLHGLFLLAGAVMAVERRRRMIRQLRVYFLLSVPFMVLQVAGAGAWTLALNTETAATGDQPVSEGYVSRRMLFVLPADDVKLTIGQSRPAGLMHANNTLSLVILFALALQLGRARAPRATSTDAIFCAALVLAMAKIVMLGFILMVAWLFLTGPPVLRLRLRRLLKLTGALYLLYAILFPVLFFHHFNLFHISYSVFIRINDFIKTLDPDSALVQWLAPKLEDTPELIVVGEEEARLSGYAMIARQLTLLLPVGAIAAVIFFTVLRRLGRWSPEASRTAILVLLVAVLFPAAVPVWRSPLYWFIAGVGVMPLVWAFGLRGRQQPRIAVPAPVES